MSLSPGQQPRRHVSFFPLQERQVICRHGNNNHPSSKSDVIIITAPIITEADGGSSEAGGVRTHRGGVRWGGVGLCIIRRCCCGECAWVLGWEECLALYQSSRTLLVGSRGVGCGEGVGCINKSLIGKSVSPELSTQETGAQWLA